MVDQAVYGCTCPPPVDHGDGRWTHEWREKCPTHGPVVRGGLMPSNGAGPSSEQIVQAGAAAIERELMSGKEYSMSVDSDEALAKAVLAAVTPMIEARILRQAGHMLRSNIGAAEIPEPGDRLDRWADLTDLARKEPSRDHSR